MYGEEFAIDQTNRSFYPRSDRSDLTSDRSDVAQKPGTSGALSIGYEVRSIGLVLGFLEKWILGMFGSKLLSNANAFTDFRELLWGVWDSQFDTILLIGPM